MIKPPRQSRHRPKQPRSRPKRPKSRKAASAHPGKGFFATYMGFATYGVKVLSFCPCCLCIPASLRCAGISKADWMPMAYVLRFCTRAYLLCCVSESACRKHDLVASCDEEWGLTTDAVVVRAASKTIFMSVLPL